MYRVVLLARVNVFGASESTRQFGMKGARETEENRVNRSVDAR